MGTRDRLFWDQIFVKIPLGIKIVWKFISEGVMSIFEIQGFLFYPYCIIEAIFKGLIRVCHKKAGLLDKWIFILLRLDNILICDCRICQSFFRIQIQRRIKLMRDNLLLGSTHIQGFWRLTWTAKGRRHGMVWNLKNIEY